MANRLRSKAEVMDPLEHASLIFQRADRRIRWAARLSWTSLIVVVVLGAIEYIRLFTGLTAVDLVLMPLLAVAVVGLFLGGIISGTFYAKPRRGRTRPSPGTELDRDSLKERFTNLLAYQVLLVAVAAVLVVAWVLQLMHPALSAPGSQFMALLPAVAFLSVMGAGAVNVLYRAKRAALKKLDRY